MRGSVLIQTSCFDEPATQLSTGEFPAYRGYAHNFQGSLKDVSGCIMIPGKSKTTMRTLVNAIPQRFGYYLATLATILGCALGVYCDHGHTGILSLVRELPQKLPPGCVHDALCQTAVSHTRNIKRLDGDQVVPRDVELTQFVREVRSSVVHPQMHPLELDHGLSAVAAPLAFAADLPLGPGQFPLQLAVTTGIPYGRPAVIDDEVGESQVETDRSLDGPLRGGFLPVVDEQLGKPAIGLANDSQAAGYPLELSEVATTDEAQLGYGNLAAADVIADFEILEGSPAVPPFESRITDLGVAFLGPPEEAPKRAIQAFQRPSREFTRHGGHAGIVLPPSGKHRRLGVVADGFFPPPVGFLAMGKEVIVYTAGDVEEAEEDLLLRGSRVEPDCHGCEHAPTVIDADSFVNTNLIVNWDTTP